MQSKVMAHHPFSLLKDYGDRKRRPNINTGSVSSSHDMLGLSKTHQGRTKVQELKHIGDVKTSPEDELCNANDWLQLSCGNDGTMTTALSLRTGSEKPHANVVHDLFVHNELTRLESTSASKESTRMLGKVRSASPNTASTKPAGGIAVEKELCGWLPRPSSCSAVCEAATHVDTLFSLSSSMIGASDAVAGQTSSKHVEHDVGIIDCQRQLCNDLSLPWERSCEGARISHVDALAGARTASDAELNESRKMFELALDRKVCASCTQSHHSPALKENQNNLPLSIHDKLHSSFHDRSTFARKSRKRPFTDIAPQSPTRLAMPVSVSKPIPNEVAIHQVRRQIVAGHIEKAALLRTSENKETCNRRLQRQFGNCQSDTQQTDASMVIEQLECKQLQGSLKSSSNQIEDRASTTACPVAGTDVRFEGDTTNAVRWNGKDSLSTRSTNVRDTKRQNDGSLTMIAVNTHESRSWENEQGIKLLDILLKCAKAMADNDNSTARTSLEELHRKASLYGDSMERLAMYFADGMAALLAKKDPLKPQKDLQAEESGTGLRVFATLNKVTPFIQFAHFSINQAIVEAVQHHDTIHVVDMAFRNGCQWASLIPSLVTKGGGPPSSLRITAVGRNETSLLRSAAALERFAASINGTLKVTVEPVVVQNVEQECDVLLRPRCQSSTREFTVVNCCMQLHRLLSVAGALERFVANARSAGAKMLTLVEADANHNASGFVGRFVEALHFYAAVFDALDSSLPNGSPERLLLEQSYLASQIEEILACDGPHRTLRHEASASWRSRLAGTGCQQLRFSSTTFNQAKLLLRMRAAEGYRLSELQGGFLSLAWQDKNVVSLSVWSTGDALQLP